MGEPARNLDEEEKFQPHLRAVPGGGETTERKKGHLSSVDGGGEATPRSKSHLKVVDGEKDKEKDSASG